MSKTTRKYRNSPKKNSRTGLFLLLGGVLLAVLALAVVWFSKQDDGQANLSQTAGEGNPQLTVDQSVIDYGNVKLDTNLNTTIRVTNTGDGALQFKEQPYLEVLEGC